MLDEKPGPEFSPSPAPSSAASTMHNASSLDLEAGHEIPINDGNELKTTKSSTLSAKQNALTTTLSRTLSKVRTSDTIDPGPPPDGGWTAWRMALLTHLTILCIWGFVNSFGVFQTYYVDVLHLGSNSSVSWIGSLQVFILFGMGTFSGRATDGGYFRITYIVGSVIYLVGIFMTSLSRTYWQVFLAQGVCMGIGNGLVFVPSMALVSTYFAKNRGKALGVVTAGSATGGLVFPAIAETMLAKAGFQTTVQTMGAVMAVSAVVCATFLKPRLPPRKSGPLVEWSAFTELPYTLYLIGAFFLFWGVYIGFYFVGSYGRNILGTSQSTSISLLLTMNGAGVLARMIPNYCADRFTGPLNLLIPFAIVAGITLYSWMAVKTVTGLWIFAVFYGIFAAGIQSLFPVVLTGLTTDVKKIGVRTGMGFGVIGFAVLTGPPLAGALIGADGGRYVYTQVFAGTSMLVGSVMMAAVRWTKVGFKVRVKV